MTVADFHRLPPLIRRSDVVATGIPDAAIDSLRVFVSDAQATVPLGKLGAIRGLLHRRRKGRKKPGAGYALYRKSDLAKILGPEWQ